MYLNPRTGPPAASFPVRFRPLQPKLNWIVAVVALSGSATAQNETPQLRVDTTYWSIHAGYNQGLAFLGSEDARRGELLIIEFAKPEPQFRYKSAPAQLVQSLTYLRSRAQGYPPTTDTIGYRAAARYWNHIFPGTETFFDLGWGLSFTNPRTIDLPNNINSTPFFGVGILTEMGGIELIFAVHYVHMSNAGTNNDNQGFNALQYTIGIKF